MGLAFFQRGDCQPTVSRQAGTKVDGGIRGRDGLQDRRQCTGRPSWCRIDSSRNGRSRSGRFGWELWIVDETAFVDYSHPRPRRMDCLAGWEEYYYHCCCSYGDWYHRWFGEREETSLAPRDPCFPI